MSKPPAGHVPAPPKAARRLSRAHGSPHRQPQAVTLRYLPGATPWVRIETPTGHFDRPGTIPLIAVVMQLVGWE